MGGGGSSRWTGKDYKSLLEEATKELKKASAEGGRNVFLSFAYEDLSEVNLLRGQAKNEKSDIEFNDWSVQDPYDSDRAPYIKQKIAERIAQSSMLVVYLSNNSAISKWVAWEIAEALRGGKQVVAVHKGSSPPKNLPPLVREHSIRIVPWANLSGELKKK
jgi:hypothetical protein